MATCASPRKKSACIAIEPTIEKIESRLNGSTVYSTTIDSIISKVWSFCHTLRDDGVGYGDYLEQLT